MNAELRVESAGDNPLAAPWEQDGLPRAEETRLVSLYTRVPLFHAVDFLRGGRGRERFYWAEPGGAAELAGVGIAAHLVVPPVLGDTVESATERFTAIEQAACRLFSEAVVRPVEPVAGGKEARPRLFGGFAFQDDFVPDNTWATFSPAEFFLPHYQYARRGADAYLTINALVPADEPLTDTLRGLQEALDARLSLPPAAPLPTLRLVAERYPMSTGMWQALVEMATAAIRDKELEKVVLARVCEIEMAEPIDGAELLGYLAVHYGDCYRFHFEPRPFHGFFGATPELLARKAGRAVHTMALAGSISRGATPAEDEALAAQLLASPKNRHEHALVVAAIRDHLRDVALEPPAPPTVLRLRNIQHLLTSIAGRLDGDNLSILSLVRRLHPTPAMGGLPSDRALAFLRHHEPVPRGWYAAPIGWLDAAGDGAFAVAIRSAVTQHERAWLYAGAGIVAESQPEAEWAETALKFRPMLGALGAA